MWILGIESSCDETGVALVRADAGQGSPVLAAQALHTQAAMHEAYGGVVPELASRDHIRRVLPLIQQVMHEASLGLRLYAPAPLRFHRKKIQCPISTCA